MLSIKNSYINFFYLFFYWEGGGGGVGGMLHQLHDLFLHGVIHSVRYIFLSFAIIEPIPGFLKIYMRGH